jgi:hypothetical protein
MATASQIQQFVSQWIAAAASASDQLGVPTAYILGQWGMETAWGTQPNMGQNNPGNVGNLGGGKFQNYSSADSFVKNYVGSMRNDFPALKGGAISVSGDPSKDMSIIYGGNQKYDPGNAGYWKSVLGGVQVLMNNTGKSVQDLQVGGFKASPGGSPEQSTVVAGTNDPVTNAITGAVSSALSGLGTMLNDALVIIVALVLGILGIFILAKGQLPTPTKVVKEVTKEGETAE